MTRRFFALWTFTRLRKGVDKAGLVGQLHTVQVQCKLNPFLQAFVRCSLFLQPGRSVELPHTSTFAVGPYRSVCVRLAARPTV